MESAIMHWDTLAMAPQPAAMSGYLERIRFRPVVSPTVGTLPASKLLASKKRIDSRRSVPWRSANRRWKERSDPLPDPVTAERFDGRVEQLARHASVVSR